ncbi:hypothetical protein M405DRAFT_870110 [Rhizopogon salebrosus TDB-379]|nr:hypothetical protein M405DRAFT_870110 [Rhizopogon salebrosus TDB-379]
MPPDARLAVLDTWKLAIRKTILEEISTPGKNHNECQDQLSREFGEAMVATLTGKRIIGCTTAGAAKFAQDIRVAGPDALLVEEAGEIPESYVLTAMGENTSQMILIGDHKQLCPKVNNYNLTVEKGDGFELNRSLFERLVLKSQGLSSSNSDSPTSTLTYPDLTNAAEIQGRANGRAVQNNFVFIDHRHTKDNDAHISDKGDGASSSKSRKDLEDLVLTPYLEQLAKLRDVLKKDNDPVLNHLDSHDLV